jgi:hypothetical protein
MQRAAARAQDIALRIVQNVPRLRKITAPRGLERLVEEHFFATNAAYKQLIQRAADLARPLEMLLRVAESG